jgi:RNA polymerase sporulation-specific sigma factor
MFESIGTAAPQARKYVLPRYSLLNPAGKYAKSELGTLLRADHPEGVYKRIYPVDSQGRLRLRIIMDNGKYTRDICQLQGLSQIFITVREERLENGGRRKVLRGWEKEQDWIDEDQSGARIMYVLSHKKGGAASWSLLEDPLPLIERNPVQMARYFNRRTIEIMTEGLGDQSFERWWNVYQYEGRSRAAVVLSSRNKGRRHDVRITGFNRFDRVYLVMVERSGQIMASFYKNEEDAARKTEVIKAAVLSEKIGEEWCPLERPRIIYDRATVIQKRFNPDRQMLQESERDVLIRSAQGGSKSAAEYLVYFYEPLIGGCAAAFDHSTISFEELVQMGRIHFLKIIDNFDPDRCRSIERFAKFVLRRLFRREIEAEKMRRRMLVELDAPLTSGEDDFTLADVVSDPPKQPEVIEMQDRRRIIEGTIDSSGLTGRQAEVLALRYLDQRELTQVEVGVQLGVTDANVSALERAAVKKLRKGPFQEMLREAWGG